MIFLLDNRHFITERQFKRLLKLKLTEKQKQIVYVNGFNYYLSENDGKKVKQFYRLVNTLKEEEIKQSTRISYDIFHEKGYTYLDEVLENYKHCADEEKYVNEFLLSVMYKNKGDHEKAAYYEELSKKTRSISIFVNAIRRRDVRSRSLCRSTGG